MHCVATNHMPSIKVVPLGIGTALTHGHQVFWIAPPFGAVLDDFKKDGTFFWGWAFFDIKQYKPQVITSISDESPFVGMMYIQEMAPISALMRLHQPCWSRNIISKVWCSSNCEWHTSPHRWSGWGGFLGMWKGCYGSWKRRLCQKENEIVCHLNCVLGMVFGHTSLLWDEFPAQPSNVCSFPRSIPVPASCSCHWPAAKHRAVHQMVFLLQ